MAVVNRKERRRMEKLGYSKKEVMDRYTRDITDKAFSAGIKHTADSIMIITAYVLHTHLGLGKKRLPEIMYWVHENIDSFNTRSIRA